MPTLSASDYTTYLKFKAAAVTGIKPAIQTRDNVATNQSIINANTLTSQAAYVVTPYSRRVVASSAAVTDASVNTVTEARTLIITAAAGGSNVITYTTSQAHGLSTGDVVSILGLTQNTLNTTPNVSDAAVTVTGATTFTVASSGSSGASSGTGRIVGRVYYTTTVAHGLVAGMTVTITNLSTFTASNATVLAAPTATTFVLSSTTTGTAETSAAGTISGYVYYTTNAAHGLVGGTQNVTITGLSTSAFNLTLVTATLVPSSTVFAVQSTATGTEVTGASGVLTVTYFANTATSLVNNARVVGIQEVQTRSTNKAKSTLSWTSGTSGSVSSTSSSKIQQPGGLPRLGTVGTYTRLPQGAGWGTNNH
jgi:hypothetical protein